MKIYVILFCIGAMEAQRVTDQALSDNIRRGELTSRYIDRYQIGLSQLERPYKGKTPLSVAISGKLDETVSILIGAGVNVKKQADGTIPLELAVKNGTVPMVRMLLTHGAVLTSKACRLASKRMDMVNFFVDTIGSIKLGARNDGHNDLDINRKDVDFCLKNMLLTVENQDDLQRLLHHGAYTDYRDETGEVALDHVIKKCHSKNAKILISQGSPVAQQKNMDEVTQKCDYERGRMLRPCCQTEKVLLQGKPTDTLYPAFLQQVKKGNVTDAFLKTYFTGLNGLDINRTFEEIDGEDALALAVRLGHLDNVKLLLRHGASAIEYAFEIALKNCTKKMIRLLLDHGALLKNINKPLSLVVEHNSHAQGIIPWLAPLLSRKNRNEALLLACLKGNQTLVELLIDSGAHLNYEQNEQSPLWNALLSHNELLVNYLIERNVPIKLTPEQRVYLKSYFPTGYELVSKGN